MRTALLLSVLIATSCQPIDDVSDAVDAGGQADDAGTSFDAGTPTDAGVNACIAFEPASPDERLGEFECPLIDDGARCPNACASMIARRFDANRCCIAATFELVTCMEANIPIAGSVNCYVRDDIAFAASGPFTGFAGWRSCTENETNVVMSAESCP